MYSNTCVWCARVVWGERRWESGRSRASARTDPDDVARAEVKLVAVHRRLVVLVHLGRGKAVGGAVTFLQAALFHSGSSVYSRGALRK
jgi:hypothetical protein